MKFNSSNGLVIAILISVQWVKARAPNNSSKNENSERMTISFGDFDEGFDDLEIIPESKNHDVINQKLEKFHDFVKNYKDVKHPWEKSFIKNVEYQKSGQMYRKMMRDTIKRIRNLERKRRRGNSLRFIELLNQPFIGKRQLPKILNIGGNANDDDDHDDAIENEVPIPQSNPYEMLKEYEKEMDKDRSDGLNLNYSSAGKPEQTLMDAFRKIVDLKTPPNCKNVTGYGLSILECLAQSYHNHEMSGKQVFMALINLICVWILIYLSIAIPLWCIKGWGCCCITWKYCKPKKMVEEVQEYIAQNPPGVFINENGEEEHYAPSLKEKELYDSINKKILKL
ncbi:UNVERIFIED_CONTAM: hypothetical protein PYX00_007158 [Menopon gallinae]|uniref:Uncharacterized protein n=1 Tax=Menopon gallinae TaxID=328185 RepID=A0AAW2HHN6_9NEOP